MHMNVCRSFTQKRTHTWCILIKCTFLPIQYDFIQWQNKYSSHELGLMFPLMKFNIWYHDAISSKFHYHYIGDILMIMSAMKKSQRCFLLFYHVWLLYVIVIGRIIPVFQQNTYKKINTWWLLLQNSWCDKSCSCEKLDTFRFDSYRINSFPPAYSKFIF